jgi:predicted nucleic acid-binding protein
LRRADVMKTLIDSSVWIAYFRKTIDSTVLNELIANDEALTHILVEAELRAGNLSIDRQDFFSALHCLNYAPMIAFDEVFQFIEAKKLFAKGVSFVDVMLIMSALTVGARIWSLDKNLVQLANHLQLATLKL